MVWAGFGASAAFVLIAAGFSKITPAAQRSFPSQVKAYGLLPSSLATLVARCLPLVELVAGFGALLGLAWAVTVGASLFMAFGIAITVNLLRGRRELVCGCFGPTGRHKITVVHVVGDLALAGAIVGSLAVGENRLLIASVGVSLVALVALLAQLVAILRIARSSQPISGLEG